MLRGPDRRYRPDHYEAYTVAAGTPVFRIFNHVAAAAGKYGALDFNDTQPALREPLRFAPMPGPLACPFIYLGTSLTAVFRETVLREPQQRRGHKASLSRAALAERSYIAGIVVQPFVLIRLFTADDLDAFKAPLELLHTRKYKTTRKWSDYFRLSFDEPAGLIWPSTRQGQDPVMILFGDRLPPLNRVLMPEAPHPFASPTGDALALAFCDAANVDLQ